MHYLDLPPHHYGHFQQGVSAAQAQRVFIGALARGERAASESQGVRFGTANWLFSGVVAREVTVRTLAAGRFVPTFVARDPNQTNDLATAIDANPKLSAMSPAELGAWLLWQEGINGITGASEMIEAIEIADGSLTYAAKSTIPTAETVEVSPNHRTDRSLS